MLYISISAIKGGFRELYRTKNAPQGISRDIRPDSGSSYSVGQEAYAISFLDSGLICSKCKIVRDVLGGSRVGNITISLFLPNNEKLSGEDIKTLLDKLLDNYSKEYIDSDHNLGNVYEDWNFVDAIISQYKSKPNPQFEDAKKYQSGTADASYLYYKTNGDLQKYFASPYQEEYRNGNYRQVFFIKSDLENTDQNPLHALRHNSKENLTDIVDIFNDPFWLKEFHGTGKNGLTIEIWANEKRRYNKDIIKTNDTIRIKYSKNKFYKEIDETGKLHDDIIKQYLSIDKDNRISVENDISLSPRTNTIKFVVNKNKEGIIYDAKISVKKNKGYWPAIEVVNNEIIFKAEELFEEWTAIAEKDGLISQPISFTPEIQNVDLRLFLEKHLKVTINATDADSGDIIPNIKLQVAGKNEQPKNFQIEFIGEEINKPWSITISHYNYESEQFIYFPSKHENPKYVPLKRKKITGGERSEKIKYKVNVGVHGKFIRVEEGYDYYSSTTNGSDVRDKIVVDKGYKLIEFKLSDDTLIAQYQRKDLWFRSSKIISGIITGIIAIVILCIILFSGKSVNQGHLKNIDKEVIQYCKGIELDHKKLKDYQAKYCLNNETRRQESGNNSFWEIFWPFGSKQENKSKETAEPDECQTIDSALAIREAINLGNIEKLKSMKYSENQMVFIGTINKINENFKQKIGEALLMDSSSKKDLNHVAEYIKNLQRLLQIREKVKMLTDKEDLENLISEIDNIKFSVDSIINNIHDEIDIKINSSKNVKVSVDSPTSNGGGSTTKTGSVLTGTKPNPTGAVKSTLETDFWNLVRSNGSPVKQDYDKLISKYKNGNKEVIDFYNTYLQLSTSKKDKIGFDKFKQIPEMERIKAKKLTDLENLIKSQ